jgi:hypothetical protein
MFPCYFFWGSVIERKLPVRGAHPSHTLQHNKKTKRNQSEKSFKREGQKTVISRTRRQLRNQQSPEQIRREWRRSDRGRRPHYRNPRRGLTGGEAVEKEGDRYEQRAEDERQHRQPRAPPPLRRRRRRLHHLLRLLPLPTTRTAKTLISSAAAAAVASCSTDHTTTATATAGGGEGECLPIRAMARGSPDVIGDWGGRGAGWWDWFG